MTQTTPPQTPSSYSQFVPYATYAAAIQHTQDLVTAAFAAQVWSPVLLLQPDTNTTLFAAEVLRRDVPYKRGVKLQVPFEDAAKIVGAVMNLEAPLETRTYAKAQWDALCENAAQESPDYEMMVNPDVVRVSPIIMP